MDTGESSPEQGSLKPHISIATAMELGAAILSFTVRKPLDDHAVWRLLSSCGGRSPRAVQLSDLRWSGLE
jgi:hypothetical protein